MKKNKIVITAFIALAVLHVRTATAQQLVKLTPILEVEDTIAGAQLGAYVKGVGDLNHDGYADVAVSAPGLFKTYIYYGGKTMSKTPSLTLKGGGHIVSGDFRGNGWTDLAIEIPFHDTVLVYFNGPNGLDTIPDLVLTQPSDYFGYVMTAGDFYGNGYTDLAIGTMDENQFQNKALYQRGRIFIYAGGPFMSATPVDTVIGDTNSAALGTALATGDVYGNGKDELVALGFNESCGNYPCSYTYLSVYTNNEGYNLKRTLYIDSRNVPGGFGPPDSPDGSVACFDADGDGIPDILVSGICIFKGGAKIDTLPTYRVGPPRGDTTDYGAYPWVAGGGDYNGDGIPDILLASERGGGLGMTSGVFVMVDGIDDPGQFAGYRVYAQMNPTVDLSGNPENAGDVNGGGVDDIIVGNGGWFPFVDYGFFGIYSGDTAMKAQDNVPPILPKEMKLEQNYPNPFNPTTTISYQLSAASHVSLKIYDTLGREVITLVNDEEESPGTYTVHWNGTNREGERVSSGVYFYQLTTDDGTQTKKAVFLK